MNGFNSRPIPNDTLFMDLKTPRFLVVEDLTERWKIQSMDVEIFRFAIEDTWPSMKDIDPDTKKPKVKEATVMYFKSTKTGKEYPRGMMIDAKENRDALQAATKAKTVGDMIGKRITIYVGEWRKKPVLRISPTPPAATPSQAALAKTNGHTSRLDQLKETAKTDVIVAYSELCKAVGLDQAASNAVLRESGGDLDAAFNKLAEQYREVLS